MSGRPGEDRLHLGRLFVSMALLYPWATKEYMLWQMSLAQIILYHHIGIELKYPQPTEESQTGDDRSIARMAYEDVKRMRDEARKMMAEDKQTELDAEVAKSEARKDEYRAKYGAI